MYDVFNPPWIQQFGKQANAEFFTGFNNNKNNFSDSWNILSYIEQFQNSWPNFKPDAFMFNPYVQKLEEAIAENDLGKQKKILRDISNMWFGQSNFMFSKNIGTLVWQKDFMQTQLKNMQVEHFGTQDVQDIKDCFSCLVDLYEIIISLSKNFDDFDRELGQIFVYKVIDDDISITDVSGLFNAWSEAFDKYYKECTFKKSYQDIFANLVKNISKFKLATQKIIDTNVEQFGLPSNREMKSVHLRLSELRKQLRKQDSDKSESLLKQIKDKNKAIKEMQNKLNSLEDDIALLKQAATKPRTKAKSTTSKSAKATKTPVKRKTKAKTTSKSAAKTPVKRRTKATTTKGGKK